MNAAPIVKISGLNKRFGTGPRVLDGIELEVSQGEFVSFIGPSGCGKSTLLRLIAGLTSASEGRITVDGMEPEKAREKMFFVFQDATLMPWRRVAENVELPLLLRGDAPAHRHERVGRMLEMKFPWQLSGGMRMRVSIARALSLAPEILLLDEPFGALDEMTRDRLNEDLLSIRSRDPFTGFFVTHSVAEAVFLSSRIVVLGANPGRVTAVIDVPFPYPRQSELRETPAFLRLLATTAQALRAVRS
jgi:NitT/TauT family transport system ATP-binding protein